MNKIRICISEMFSFQQPADSYLEERTMEELVYFSLLIFVMFSTEI